MDEKLKDLLLKAKSPEDAVRIAAKYGYATEIKKNKELSEDDLSDVSGGKTEETVTRVSYSVVVRNKDTGEILYVMEY